MFRPDDRSAGGRDGFSLVEVSIALFVIAIGIISVLSLFPAGLDLSKAAIDETYASFFADSVFASYKGFLDHQEGSAPGERWNTLDTYRSIAPNTIDRGVSVMWKDPANMQVIPDGQPHVLEYIANTGVAKWDAGGNPLPGGFEEIRDHALQYRLTVSTDPVFPRIKRLVLEIWASEFADAASVQPDEVFYAEVFNYGI